VGLDILKFKQTSLFYGALYFNREGLKLGFRETISPQKPLPMATGLCAKTSVCFLMQLIDSEKYLGYVKLAKSVKLSVYKHASA